MIMITLATAAVAILRRTDFIVLRKFRALVKKSKGQTTTIRVEEGETKLLDEAEKVLDASSKGEPENILNTIVILVRL